MKKGLLAVVAAVVIVAALGTAGLVFAQTPTPQAPAAGPGFGYGMNGNGRGMQGAGRGYNANATGAGQGILHDAMVVYFAEKLNLPVDGINSRLANGETMAQIAYSTGLTVDQFRTLMVDARNQAIDQAVKDGTLTQTQADWMKQHGAGLGGGRGAGMQRGAGQGQYANPACPYYQTN